MIIILKFTINNENVLKILLKYIIYIDMKYDIMYHINEIAKE